MFFYDLIEALDLFIDISKCPNISLSHTLHSIFMSVNPCIRGNIQLQKNVFYFQKTVVAAVCSLSAWRNWRQLRKLVSTIWLRERDLEREGGDSRQCTRHTNSDTGEAGESEDTDACNKPTYPHNTQHSADTGTRAKSFTLELAFTIVSPARCYPPPASRQSAR